MLWLCSLKLMIFFCLFLRCVRARLRMCLCFTLFYRRSQACKRKIYMLTECRVCVCLLRMIRLADFRSLLLFRQNFKLKFTSALTTTRNNTKRTRL